MVSGQIRQLPTGDTLDAAVSEVDVVSLANGTTSAIAICTPVYISSGGSVSPAQANASATQGVIGLVKDPSIASSAQGNVQTDGGFTATTSQWDTVTGQTGGLTPGAVYFLSAASPGKLTATAPTADGQYVVPVGKAFSSTLLDVSIGTSVLL